MAHSTCKAEGCNNLVADPTQDFCRSCRAKIASVAQEVKAATDTVADGIATGVGLAGAEDDLDLDDEIEALTGALTESHNRALGDEPMSSRKTLNNHLYGRFGRPQPQPPRNGYCPFEIPPYIVGENREWTLQVQPQRPFKPEALMLWGFNDLTTLKGIYIGQEVQGACCFGELPASFFGTAKSYEKLIGDFEKNGISPPNWITWSTCNVGAYITLSGKGPLSHAVFLGKYVY